MTDIKVDTIKKDKEKVIIEREEEEVKSIQAEVKEQIKEAESSACKFLVQTGKKRLGKKKTKYMALCSNDLPDTIQGKILENCIIRGANITATRSHDIKLDRVVAKVLDSIKLLLEGKAVEGALGGIKLIGGLLGPGAEALKDIINKLDGKGSVIVQKGATDDIKQLQEDYKLLFEGLSIADSDRIALDKQLEQVKYFFDERLKDFRGRFFNIEGAQAEIQTDIRQHASKIQAINIYCKREEKDTLSGFAAIEKRFGTIEKGKQKTLSLPSILKRDGHCISSGCCVVLEKIQIIPPYKATKVKNLGVSRGLPFHNAKGNWIDDEQCYMVSKRGYYQAKVISRVTLNGGGDRLAIVQVELPPKDGEPGQILSFRGSKVVDSKLESEVFSAESPQLLLEIGTRITCLVSVRGASACALSPIGTYFSVSALGHCTN